MESDLRSLMRDAGYRSWSSLGKALHTGWKDLEPRSRVPEHRVLAVYVARLAKGESSWWLANDTPSRLLAELLGVGVADLPLRGRRSQRDRLFLFDDFPDVRPFDPARETPCELARFVEAEAAAGLFSHQERTWFDSSAPEEAVWFSGPPGAGRSFAALWHKVRGPSGKTALLTVNTLEEALAVLPPTGPLVVDVGTPAADRDATAVRELGRRRNVLVLAPFGRPRCQPPREERVTRDDEDDEHDDGGWTDLAWRPAKDWRARFVTWIASRIDPPPAQLAEVMLRWLQRVDPRERLLRTPGDLVPLCAIAFDEPEGQLMQRWGTDLAASFVGNRLRRAAPGHTARELWLRSSGAEAAQALAGARLETLALPLAGGLSRHQWASLLPSAQAPMTSPEELAEAAMKACASTKSARRGHKQVAEVLAPIVGPRPIDAIDHLASVQVLRPSAGGLLSLHPAWAATRWNHGRVAQALEHEEPRLWGRWAAEPVRRPLVDEQLDILSDQQLVRLLERVVTEFDAGCLGGVGSVEALYAAVGRRLQGGLRPRPGEAMPLWRLQWSLLVTRHEQGLPCPRTRPGLSDVVSRSSAPTEDDAAFVADCWAWSLAMPRPEIEFAPELAWLFPGWLDPTRDAKAWQLPKPHLRDGWPTPTTSPDMHAVSAGWHRLVYMAPAVLEHFRTDALEITLPAYLMPAAFMAARSRGWSVVPLVPFLLDTKGLADCLVAAAELLPEPDRGQLAVDLWNALVGHDRAPTLARALELLGEKPRLEQFLLDRLSPELLRAFAASERAGEIRLARLPSALRRLAVELASGNAVVEGQYLAQAKELGADDVETLEKLAECRPAGWWAMERLWDVDGERALSFAERALATGSDPDLWFAVASRPYLPKLLTLLERSSARPLAGWTRPLLATWVLEGGATAEAANRLLGETTPERTCLPSRPSVTWT